MEPSSNFWTYLFIAVAVLSFVGILAAVLFLKLVVFRPAEKRAKREAEGEATLDLMESNEIVSLIRKLDKKGKSSKSKADPVQKQLFANLRDQLTKPLEVIKAESFTLARSSSMTDHAPAIADIRDSAIQLESTVLDLYDLFTLEVGRAQLTQETVSVQQLVDEIMAKHKMFGGSKNRVHIEIGDDVRSVITDHGKLQRLLTCQLLSADSTIAGGNIYVNIGYADDGRFQTVVFTAGGKPQKSTGDTTSVSLKPPLAKKLAEFLGGGFELETTPGGGLSSVARISVRTPT